MQSKIHNLTCKHKMSKHINDLLSRERVTCHKLGTTIMPCAKVLMCDVVAVWFWPPLPWQALGAMYVLSRERVAFHKCDTVLCDLPSLLYRRGIFVVLTDVR